MIQRWTQDAFNSNENWILKQTKKFECFSGDCMIQHNVSYFLQKSQKCLKFQITTEKCYIISSLFLKRTQILFGFIFQGNKRMSERQMYLTCYSSGEYKWIRLAIHSATAVSKLTTPRLMNFSAAVVVTIDILVLKN